ncbi:MAG: SRPBCC domain-containing protein [Phycisphaerae bacterium]|nr:SRPBCC domain-containing protein [Saprospiraceae bacterium]
MKTSFTISDTFPTTPDVLYAAWLDSEVHAAMTEGGEAVIDAALGTYFSAWDGYISGKNLELEPERRIVQSWRTSDFQENDADSKVEILLTPVPKGTKLTLIHTEIPAGQPDYEEGWEDFYFKPMHSYFK